MSSPSYTAKELREARKRLPKYRWGGKVEEEDGGGVLAVMLLIIDELPHEEAWRAWAETAGESTQWSVMFVVHAKYPDRVSSPWVRHRLIKECYTPEWGSVEIVRATLALMNAALLNARVQRLVLASETCVPVTTLAEAVAAFRAEPRSWVNVGLSRGRFDDNKLKAVSAPWLARHACRSDQWIALTRAHAQLVIDLPILLDRQKAIWRSFRKVETSDEIYFSTVLAALGVIDLAPLKAAAAAVSVAQQAGASVANLASMGRRARLRALKKRKREAKAKAAAATVGTSAGVGAASGSGAASGAGAASTAVASSFSSEEVAFRRCTFVQWGNYFDAHPHTYEALDVELMLTARRAGALFVRKVSPAAACSRSKWRKLLRTLHALPQTSAVPPDGAPPPSKPSPQQQQKQEEEELAASDSAAAAEDSRPRKKSRRSL